MKITKVLVESKHDTDTNTTERDKPRRYVIATTGVDDHWGLKKEGHEEKQKKCYLNNNSEILKLRDARKEKQMLGSIEVKKIRGGPIVTRNIALEKKRKKGG